MKTFADLDFKAHAVAQGGRGTGVRAQMNFDNGYGVSVVQFSVGGLGGSYGSEQGLFELAVLKGEDLCYDTNITDDVLGWLSPAAVTDIMAQVQALPPA